MGMFPKSASGTSGKLRENKGNDMAEDGLSDATLRQKLADVVRHVKNGSDLQFRTDSAYGKAIIWASERIAELEAGSPLPDSDEEIRQRRRRERMLDEITLSSVRGFLHLHAEEKTYREIGVSARDRAEDICRGIDEFDAR